jgi:peptide/nickel transport system substrate-binding protein
LLFQGNGAVTDQPFNPAGEAYNKDVVGTYKFDPAGARQLLAEAGYPNGFSMKVPSTVISQSFEPTITQAMKDIGITLEWEPVPPQNTASSLASKKYPAALWFMGLNVAGIEASDLYGPTGFLNPFNTQDAKLTEILTRIKSTVDPAARAKVYQELTAYTVENAYNAPIAYVGTLYATSKKVDFVPEISVVPTIRTFAVAAG